MLDGGNGSSTPNVLETFELYGAYVENVNYNTLAYATSDPATITMSVRYDNCIQTPQGTGIGTAVARTIGTLSTCLLYTSPSPRDGTSSRMPSSA